MWNLAVTFMTTLSAGVSTGSKNCFATTEAAGYGKITDFSYSRKTFPCCLNPRRMFLVWFILNVLIIPLSTNIWSTGLLWSHDTTHTECWGCRLCTFPFKQTIRMTWKSSGVNKHQDLAWCGKQDFGSGISFWVIFSNRLHSCLSHLHHFLKMNQHLPSVC